MYVYINKYIYIYFTIKFNYLKYMYYVGNVNCGISY